MTLDKVQRSVRTTHLRSWKWTEHWGPQITDRTEWTVTTTGGQIHLQRGTTQISMSREVAGNVVDALSDALDDDDTCGCGQPDCGSC